MYNEVIFNREPWNNIGIEIEYTDIVPNSIEEISRFLRRRNWRDVHDASVESPTQLFKNKPIKGKTLDADLNRQLFKSGVIGGEIVTGIINTENKHWLSDIDEILSLLKFHGERVNTNRGSIHIHINTPHDYKGGPRFTIGFLRRCWMLAGYFEQAFFRVGALTREHRGRNMDFIYYRPITGYGPPIYQRGNFYCPILIYEHVLESKTVQQFFTRCSDIYHADGRYHASRYMWINFYNMYHFSNGPNLEFRIFNKTLRSDYVYAIVELCKSFVRAAYKYDTEELENILCGQINGLGDELKESSAYFDDLIKIFEIEDIAVIQILDNIWTRSHYPEYLNDRVLSHLSRNHLFRNCDEQDIPQSLNKNEVMKIRNAQYVDIHRLKRTGDYIFPEETL